MSEKVCCIDDCARPHAARGWCLPHYKRWKRSGDPNLLLREMDAAERFWRKFVVDRATGCWNWTGATSKGYGNTTLGGQGTSAHRAVYTLLVESVPAHLEVDHLCRNTHCVNPAHMEVVTGRENTLRGSSPSAVNARRTHCIRGHAFDAANTIVRSDGKRQCRACSRARKAGTP